MTGSALAGKRVAYVPYSRDLSGPGDRRRFCEYARLRGVAFEAPTPGREYDVVILSSLADLTAWSRLPRGATKLVYELVDSYLEIDPQTPRALIRGAAKFLLRQHQHLELSYHQSLRRMLRRADAVVCSTPEQKARIAADNPNTHPILDFHGNEVKQLKTSYARGPVFNLLWEGLAGNLVTFASISEPLRELSRTHRLALHLVTDLTFPIANGPLLRPPTRRLIDRYLPGVETYLYEWNAELFSAICVACDLALIPMIQSPIYLGKPENKLLLMWRMGLPTLTAVTPAYQRVMASAGLSLTCRSQDEWRTGLARLMGDEAARREAGEQGRAYVNAEHSEARLVARWDALFETLWPRG